MRAETVAKWFIRKNAYLSSGYIDENTKINKLLYFANLYSYAILDEKMIDDKFVAFRNGPVVYSIYRDYRYNGLNRYPKNEVQIDDKYSKILDIVNFVYGNKGKDELVNISHEHNVWSDVKSMIPNNPEIIFENASEELLDKCKNIYETYKNFDFNKIKREVICRNVYYYDIDNIPELTDKMINELMELPRNHEPQFIEVIEGELVLS